MISSCVRYSTLFFQRDDATCKLSTLSSSAQARPPQTATGLIPRADYIVPATVWTIIEADVTIISACLIVSRPWLTKLYPSRFIHLIKERSIRWSARRSSRRSAGRKGLFSSFARLTETPPAVDASMGAPFEFDVEKNIEIEHMSGGSRR
jgi:hypothetical protein